MKFSSFTVIAVCLLSITMTACSQSKTVTGSQKYITQRVKVESFNGLQLMGSPNVTYKQSEGKPSVEIYGSDNIVELMEVYVNENDLIVKFKDNISILSSGKLEVRVSGPALKKISVQGSGDIKLSSGMQTNGNIDIKIQGSGDISGNNISCSLLSLSIAGSGDISLSKINVLQTKANISGSGDIDLSGACQKAEYNIHGSGDINASNFQVENVSASVNGSGDISCHATEVLQGHVSGSGEVSYKGSPKIDFSRKGLRKL